jgi:hypothetical protein
VQETCSQSARSQSSINGCFAMFACRYDLHVLLVEHGKRCPRCASNGKPRKESHGDCPLVNLKMLAAGELYSK